MWVEVVAGTRDRQVVRSVEVSPEATVWDAVLKAKLDQEFPDLELDENRIGIFGVRCRADRLLQPGDRVEVYRPLSADPKEVRREMAKMERARRNSVV